MNKKLTLSLYENSIDFLNESLKRAIQAQKDILEWKYAILSLITSIELAMKARLEKEHHEIFICYKCREEDENQNQFENEEEKNDIDYY